MKEKNLKEILENGKYVIEYKESDSDLFSDYYVIYTAYGGYIEYDKKYKFYLYIESYDDGTYVESYKSLYIDDKDIEDEELVKIAYNKIHKTLIKQILNQ